MWIPTIAKILNFAEAWLNTMKVPELNDPVLGHNDPGGVPVAISAMGSASGQIFATIENNLQFLHDTMVVEDVTINVTSVAELQAALDILDRVTHVYKDKVFGVNIAAAVYAWPAIGLETRSPINISGIHGGGSVVFSVAGVTLQGDSSLARPLVNVYDCTCNVVISGALTLENTEAAAARAVSFSKVLQVTATDLIVKNSTSSDKITSAVYCREAAYVQLGLTVNTLAGADTGIGRAIYARVNSNVHIDAGDLTIGILTNELIYLEKNSQINFERFDGFIPSGLNMASLSQVATIDGSSKIAAHEISGSGSGTSSSPYVITIAWESATATIVKIQNTIDMLPKPLDVFVDLKLPAGAVTDVLTIADLFGSGRLKIIGNTVLSAKGVTQDSIFDNGGSAVQIERCRLPILLHSLKMDSETGIAALNIDDSNNVRCLYCYNIAPTGIGAPSNGNGFYTKGAATNLWIQGCKVGTCNQNGIFADEGSNVRYIDSTAVGGGALPAQYGNYARNAAVIYRENSSYLAGLLGGNSEGTGGKVFTS